MNRRRASDRIQPPSDPDRERIAMVDRVLSDLEKQPTMTAATWQALGERERALFEPYRPRE
jgi:hypothetical protein